MNQSGQTQGSTQPAAASASPRWDVRHPALIASILAVVTLAVFWPVGGYQYLHYDDTDYVTSNPQVLAGLTPAGVAWAFQGGHAGNWHPLTWLSHMLDVQLFGPGPAASHLVNLVFHALNTFLLFLVLREMTGAFWRSALVTALFALHPLHVESVAWIAERKDVLSGLFFILTLWAYTKYARSRSPGLRPSVVGYVLALTFFALGLMSKPMLVTLPFVMLLLDYWPLQRVQTGNLGSLFFEKAPFFLLSALSSVITFNVQQVARQPLINCPMSGRIANALVAYVRYLGKTVLPVNLANPYPLPAQWPLVDVILSAVLLLALCLGALLIAKKIPFVFTGWFWFFGMLVPVIGLIQVGSQSMADRYTYLPLIGLFVVFVWSAAEIVTRLRLPTVVVGALSAVVLVGCLVRTHDQLHYWRDSESLFGHAIAVTKDNWLAYYNLGWSSDEAGRLDEALEYYRLSAELRPAYPEVQNNIGFTLVRQGRLAEAVPYFQEAVRLRPSFADAGDNLGLVLLRLGRTDEAIAQFRAALERNPGHVGALNNLANALSAKGEFIQALQYYEDSLRLQPLQPSIQYSTGNTLARLKRIDEAIEHYRKAIEQKPDYVEAHYALGMALSQKGDLDHAIAQVTEAVRYKPDDALLQANLGKLLAAERRFDDAIAVFKEALRLAPDNPDTFNALGAALAMKGDLDGAIAQFREAIRVRPDNASAHFNLGKALATQHKFEEAASQFNEALRLRPDFAAARQELQAIETQHENPH